MQRILIRSLKEKINFTQNDYKMIDRVEVSYCKHNMKCVKSITI